MDGPTGPLRVRLAELLALLSLGADLGMAQPMEHVLRQSLIALRLAEHLELSEADREVVYYTSLVAWVGCHVDAYEQAKWFGDDLAMKGDVRRVDTGSARAGVSFMLQHLGAGSSGLARARTVAGFVTRGYRDAAQMLRNHWLAADDLAERLGLGDAVRGSIEQTFERWDGKGDPNGTKGDAILLTSRLVSLADVVEVFHRAGGVDAARAVAEERRGTQFDPDLVDVFCAEAPTLFEDLDTMTSWDTVISSEPVLHRRVLADRGLVDALEAVADFTDVKSPCTLGHSRAVADLAAEAATVHGLPDEEVQLVRCAALVHDLGRLGVSNEVWDKKGPLTPSEVERVRLHPYITERMLASSPALAPLGAVAVQHHERLDGSGYPRGLTGDALSPAGRILAAADMYRGRTEPRPHRPAGSADDTASALRDEVRAGRLDGEAVDAVLKAAGHRVARRRDWPAGLTTREVEVLRLLARGLTNKQIAERLFISRKTVNNHIEHIYAKTGVTNRALAGLFASKQGLMADAEMG